MKKDALFDITMGSFMILLGLAMLLMAGAVAYECCLHAYDSRLERKSRIHAEAP